MVGRLSLPAAAVAPELPDSPGRRRRRRTSEQGPDSPNPGSPPSPAGWPRDGPAPPGSEQGALPPRARRLSDPGAPPASPPPPPGNSEENGGPAPSAGCAAAARLCTRSFGEGVAIDPLPPTDVRYTSSVKYYSKKHFIRGVDLPVALRPHSCSQTVVCVPGSTWRSYKAEVRLQPRHRARRFSATTIIYPKRASTVYTTTLDYDGRKHRQRFLSTVELEAAGKESG